MDRDRYGKSTIDLWRLKKITVDFLDWRCPFRWPKIFEKQIPHVVERQMINQ
jgi:hypothetical protein